jgi:hypothetical protein
LVIQEIVMPECSYRASRFLILDSFGAGAGFPPRAPSLRIHPGSWTKHEPGCFTRAGAGMAIRLIGTSYTLLIFLCYL